MKKLFFLILLSIIVTLVGFWLFQQVNNDNAYRQKVTSEMFRVVDGDTVYFNGDKARLLGFDTAELAFYGGGTGLPTPFSGDQEPYASQAKEKLRDLINNSDTVEVAFADETDKYNRNLIHIYINGVPVGVIMIEVGLAYETISRYGDNGFPDEARSILHAAQNNPPPLFENPHVWRRTHSTTARSD